jgi:hydroxyethylthiazole kinase-like uncharacterized protein yjeF
MMREIITVAEMRAIDEAAAKNMSSLTLMENAGRAVADAICKDATCPFKVAVLCGPGNNGGDGWAAACVLAERGWDQIEIWSLVDRDALRGDAREAALKWKGRVNRLTESLPDAELYVDALFGAGLSRPLEEPVCSIVRALAQKRNWVVAIDVPSGLNGDTGEPLGKYCVRAAQTVTFVRKKPAHVLMPGRDYCGESLVADIGVPESIVVAQGVTLWENDPSLWRLPWPEAEAHKHARGHAYVASGGHTRTGAARLTARAALRVGAGLVTVLSPADALAENAAQLTAIMLREAGDEGAYAEAARTAQCLAIGPGFGTSDAHYKLLCAVMGANPRCPLVLDADALTLLAPITHGFTERDVMTPHLGEFRRAFPGLYAPSQTHIDAARAAAAYARCNVLFKGPDTVIAAPDGRTVVNTTGTPFLATAGSGDVLAGFIAGLIAQGMDSFAAAAAAAWLHGKIGETLGAGLIAEDLAEQLPVVLNSLAPPGLRKRGAEA